LLLQYLVNALIVRQKVTPPKDFIYVVFLRTRQGGISNLNKI
jgi:hypothetical protein